MLKYNFFQVSRKFVISGAVTCIRYKGSTNSWGLKFSFIGNNWGLKSTTQKSLCCENIGAIANYLL